MCALVCAHVFVCVSECVYVFVFACTTRFNVRAVPKHPGYIMLQNTRTKTFINGNPHSNACTAEGSGGDWCVAVGWWWWYGTDAWRSGGGGMGGVTDMNAHTQVQTHTHTRSYTLYLYWITVFSQNPHYELQLLFARVTCPPPTETGIAEPLEDIVTERGLVLLSSPCFCISSPARQELVSVAARLMHSLRHIVFILTLLVPTNKFAPSLVQ